MLRVLAEHNTQHDSDREVHDVQPRADQYPQQHQQQNQQQHQQPMPYATQPPHQAGGGFGWQNAAALNGGGPAFGGDAGGQGGMSRQVGCWMGDGLGRDATAGMVAVGPLTWLALQCTAPTSDLNSCCAPPAIGPRLAAQFLVGAQLRHARPACHGAQGLGSQPHC